MAGTIGVQHKVFTLWQVIGGLVWSIGVTVAGYVLGKQIPNVDKYLLPIIALIVIVSLIPVALELRRSRGRHG
jgi:membrane-associated protein